MLLTPRNPVPGRAPVHATSARRDPIHTRRFVSRDKNGWPPGHPNDHPKNAPASADKSPSGLSSVASVDRDDGGRRERRGQYPQADASRYEPVPGRGRPALSIRCPYCGGVHLGRLRDGSPAGGLRRTPCGKVWVVVRRTYRSKASSRTAA